MKNKLLLAVIILATVLGVREVIPVTGKAAGLAADGWIPQETNPPPSLNSGRTPRPSRSITEISSPDKFSFSVVEQPPGQAGYVSGQPETVTHFRLAAQHGSLAFLAHNYLAGKEFSTLDVGDSLIVRYNNDLHHRYKIVVVKEYQALSPNSPHSNFRDLESGDTVSATSLFYEIYDVEDRLVLQTCIENEGLETWGRMFVIAEPVPEESISTFLPLITPLGSDILN